MRSLALCLAVCLSACGWWCPDPKPPKIITVYNSCLDNPQLPKFPVLSSDVARVGDQCPAEYACFDNNGMAGLEEFLTAVAYYYSQLETLCKETKNEEDHPVPADTTRPADPS